MAVFALLALYAVMAWTASLNKGQSFDEGLQLAVGYNLWQNRDFRMEGANGDFVKRWASLPFLVSKPHFVDRQDRFWKAGASYEVAHRFFFQLGNIPEILLAQGRAMVVLLGVATGLLVFLWSRKLFGTFGAFVSLTLFAFSPHMLAFGGTVSTDMSITFALLASTWCIWRLLELITWSRLLLSLASFGLLVLAKPSALVILPIAAGLVGLRLWQGTPLAYRGSGRAWRWARRRSQVLVICLLVTVHALVGWGSIWGHYSFRYAASPVPGDPKVEATKLDYRDGMAAPLRTLLRWLREYRIVPEGFHRGVQLLAGNDDETVSFLRGEWKVGGQPSFFPYAIWSKTSPPLFLLVALGVAAWLWARRRPSTIRANSTPLVPPRSPSLPDVAPLGLLIACYLGVALAEELNIGHRHILPIYPALYIIAGGVGLLAASRAKWWKPFGCSALLVWSAAESFAIRPHYLAYFGPQVGGPEEGYRHLVDSSIDWGMDLPALKELIDRQDPDRTKPLFLAYFGTDSAQYHGLNAKRLPGFFDRRPISAYPLAPGYYAISATLLQSLYTVAVGPWSQAYEERYQIALRRLQEVQQKVSDPRNLRVALKPQELERLQIELFIYDGLRCARLCAWLRNTRDPDFRAGYSILVWNLTLEDLQAALFGPPVELTNDPLPARHYGRYSQVRG